MRNRSDALGREKALPFEPLNPNAETIAAMKAARRGELIKTGELEKLLQSLNERSLRSTRAD
jgi:DNA-damage-inducible protein J